MSVSVSVSVCVSVSVSDSLSVCVYVYDYSCNKYAPGFCILHKFLFTHIQTSGNYRGGGCFICVK